MGLFDLFKKKEKKVEVQEAPRQNPVDQKSLHQLMEEYLKVYFVGFEVEEFDNCSFNVFNNERFNALLGPNSTIGVMPEDGALVFIISFDEGYGDKELLKKLELYSDIEKYDPKYSDMIDDANLGPQFEMRYFDHYDESNIEEVIKEMAGAVIMALEYLGNL